METRYILNHFYKLRHDVKRSYILSADFVDKKNVNLIQRNWTSRMHPIFAMALSFFSEPKTMADLKEEFVFFFDISEIQAESFITTFLNNQENFKINYEGNVFSFPKNIVIEESEQFTTPIQYLPEYFAYKEVDLVRERFYMAPKTVVFMVNNTCATDCVYCYANKSVRSTNLDFDRLTGIIKEAKDLGIVDFSLVGGEVFLYKHWKELLDVLEVNDLRETLISTKVPISEEDIISLKKRRLSIQVSLDAMDSIKLQQILQVKPDYAERIKNTIRLLDKHEVLFQISTVITKYNNTVDDLNDIFSFLNTFSYLRRWEIRVAFKSLYSRKDFDSIKLSHEEVESIGVWVKEISEKTKMNISWSASNDQKYFEGDNGSSSFKGARCSANYSNMFILPDGKVSICEQLYWNSHFIIGDLTKQTIQEIWNSPRALALSFPKREDFRESSVCHTCDIFDECMAYPNKCIADVIKGYGMENIDYPDPRCSKAPKFTYSLLNE